MKNNNKRDTKNKTALHTASKLTLTVHKQRHFNVCVSNFEKNLKIVRITGKKSCKN